MSTMRVSTRSKYAGLLPIEPSDELVRPADLKKDQSPNRKPSLGKRALRTLADFLITLCVFLAAILAWRSYGNMATQMTADLYRQLVRLAPQRPLTVQKAPETTAVAASDDLYPDRQLPDADRFAAGQEQTTRSTDHAATSIAQAASAQAGGIAAESGADGASSQPMMRLDIKPTEARFPPQTLSEKGKQLSAASGHDSSCFPSASAVLQKHQGGWPTWTLRAPGHEGTLCWYAAARPRGSDHRSERVAKMVGTTESGLSAAFVPRGRAGPWDGGLP
jgi:hypothetical protein